VARERGRLAGIWFSMLLLFELRLSKFPVGWLRSIIGKGLVAICFELSRAPRLDFIGERVEMLDWLVVYPPVRDSFLGRLCPLGVGLGLELWLTALLLN